VSVERGSTTPDAHLRTPSNLRLRMVASVAMIAVAVAALWVGGIGFWLLATVIALLMMAEWARLVGAGHKHLRLGQYALMVPLAIMSPLAAGADPFALGLLIGAAFFVVIVTRSRALAAGILYCGLPVLALVLLRRQHEGIVWTLWAMGLVWATDIGAFFAGRSIGGPKLAPRLSPNKTWAGLIGGVVAAGALGALLHVYAGLPWRMTLATPFLAVLAQAGDLFESWLKRRAGVKDSGNILPGHGGVLDRLDGLVPVAPVAAFLAVLPHFLP
jgi:CDP-diglyceride synthetase